MHGPVTERLGVTLTVFTNLSQNLHYLFHWTLQ